MNGVNILPASPIRGNYLNALNGFGIGNRNTFYTNRATLRLEKLLVAGRESYKFDLYSNTASDRPLESKLNRNDSFAITGFGLYITRQDTTNSLYGNFPLYTYPEEDVFLGVSAPSRPEYEALQCLYNGKLSFRSDSSVRAQQIGTELMRYVPTTQTPSATTAQPGFGGADGKGSIFDIEPVILVNGQQNNEVILELGSGDTTLIAGGINAAGAALDPVENNVVVLLLEGFVFQNASEALVAR